MAQYLCIDAGFTRTRFALLSQKTLGETVEIMTAVVPRRSRKDPDALRREWFVWLRNAIADHFGKEKIDAIGIALPGPVGSDGVIRAANSLWGAVATPLSPSMASEWLGHPTVLCNDLYASATHFGRLVATGDVEKVLVLNIGSGIGSKLFDAYSGRVVSGRHGFDGEIGFSVIDRSDSAATTMDGSVVGTLGLYSSGSGFARMLRQYAADEPITFARSAIAAHLHDAGTSAAEADRNQLNAAAIAALRGEDTLAGHLLDTSIAFLASALHIVILFAAPDRVVLTGGFANAVGPQYGVRLTRHLAPLLRPIYSKADVEEMIVAGDAKGRDNLHGMAAILQMRYGARKGLEGRDAGGKTGS